MSLLSLNGPRSRFSDTGSNLTRVAWLLFAVLAFRFLGVWANALFGFSLPVISRTWFTVLFTAFSLCHAITLLGLGRALAFAAICAVVTWSYEDIGILTGAIYGRYHYSGQLGAKLGEVPILIPLAWFMMAYASWIVAWFLLQGIEAKTWSMATMRAVVAALAMTAWDTVMDPGMARAGVWTWEAGGPYFGVPLQNYAGWLLTTTTVYALFELAFLRVRPGSLRGRRTGIYLGLPVLLYGLMALDRILLPDLPELRIVAAFGMGMIALLATLRVATSDGQHPLPN